MKRFLLLVPVMVLASPLVAQTESDDEAIREAINELIEVRKSGAVPAQKNRAIVDFYERIRSRGDFVSLEVLLEDPTYFNVAFGQALKDNGSLLADRIYCQALTIPGYFSDDGRPGHQCNLAKMYLLDRFDLDSSDPRIKKMFDAFIDPKFLDQLSGIFQAIIDAESEEAKKEQENRAVTFLLSYDYKYWTELMDLKLQEQAARAQRELPAARDRTQRPPRERSAGDDKSTTAESPATRGGSWALWTSVGILILALGTHLIRRRRLKG